MASDCWLSHNLSLYPEWEVLNSLSTEQCNSAPREAPVRRSELRSCFVSGYLWIHGMVCDTTTNRWIIVMHVPEVPGACAELAAQNVMIDSLY